jgi:allene oxide cyclase
MRKSFVLVSIALLLVIVVAANTLATSHMRAQAAPAVQDSNVVHVVEHAITDTVVDVGPKGDSVGDLLPFANPVFDAADKKQVGTDNGNCIRTVILSGGQLTVEGPYYDSGTDSMLSIIGGTGIYKNARGQMKLHARGNPLGSEYDFIFFLN